MTDISKIIDAYRQEQQANRKQQERDERSKRRIEKWTLAFVIATTIGIFIQACILNSTDKAIHETLVVSNRPWLGLNGAVETVISLTFDKDGAVSSIKLPINNGGNSVAIGAFSFMRLVIAKWPPTGPNISAQGIREIIDRQYAVHFSPTYVTSMSNSGGGLVLPGQPLNDDDVFRISESRSNFFSKKTDETTSAWVPITIGYRDQFGAPHAMFFILLFRTDDGKTEFLPIGTVKGKFSPFWIGSLAY